MKSNNINIKLDKFIGAENTQIICEGDIIVPDNQPDIKDVLEVLVNPVAEKAEPTDGRVNYRGSIYCSILYLSGNGTVHNMNGTIPLNDFVQIEGAAEGMMCSMHCHISDTDASIVNERKINCKIFADADIIVKDSFEADVIQQLEEIPPEQQKTKSLALYNTIENGSQKITVRDSIEIPNSKPNIEKILQADCRITDKDVRVYDDKIDISGEIGINVLYKGEDESNPIEIQEGKIDFNGSIPLENQYDNVICSVRLCIDSCKYAAAEDDDGENRVISADIELSADINAVEEYTAEVLEDAYCLNKHIDMEMIETACCAYVCGNSSQFPIKESVEIEKDKPDMLRIYKVSGTPSIDEIKITDDKIIVDGAVNMTILYVTGNDDAPVCSSKAVLPFSHTIEAKGAAEGMDAVISRDISSIRYNMLSDREIEVRCMLNMDACVTKAENMQFAVNAQMTDMDKEEIKRFPSLVIYFVKPGDTLWKLSKKYNSTVQSIAELNNIENPDLIYPGQKFVIVKNYSTAKQ